MTDTKLSRTIASTATLKIANIHSEDLFYTPLEERFERITRVARRALQVPVAAITLLNDEKQWFKSAAGWGIAELPRAHSICRLTIEANQLLTIPSLVDDQRTAQSPIVVSAPRFRAYAGYGYVRNVVIRSSSAPLRAGSRRSRHPTRQWHWQVALTAGTPPIIVLGVPGVHGVVTGTHGIGVSTPSAAAVAATTLGFDGEMHMPKGGMFAPGAMSVIVAAGRPSIITRLSGGTSRVDGASPNEHIKAAPVTKFGAPTCCLPRRARAHRCEPLTDDESWSPVVVMTQMIVRSLLSCQLRADGRRYV